MFCDSRVFISLLEKNLQVWNIALIIRIPFFNLFSRIGKTHSSLNSLSNFVKFLARLLILRNKGCCFSYFIELWVSFSLKLSIADLRDTHFYILLLLSLIFYLCLSQGYHLSKYFLRVYLLHKFKHPIKTISHFLRITSLQVILP